jgi:dTDP-4-dehydrorhamnose reductase
MTRRVVVLGAAGQLGRQLTAAFARRDDIVVALSRRDLDLVDPAAPDRVVALRPDVVVNAAAWTDVDGCARDPGRAMLLNATAPGDIAVRTIGAGASFVQISTNEVFDGEGVEPYDESAAPTPINPYGASKRAGEVAVAAAGASHLIVRTAWIFGPGGNNFPRKILRAAEAARARGEPVRVVADELGNPTWAPTLAEAIVHATSIGVRGVLHLAGEPAASRFEWARVLLAPLANLEIAPISRTEFARASAAPARAVLAMERARGYGIAPLEWRTASRAYMDDLLGAAS